MKKTLYVLTCALCTLLVLPAAAQVPAYVPTDGLVGWWPFNGNANDESGNGNDGVVNGATLTEDRFGISDQAYYFSSVDCETRIDFNLTQPTINNGITISLWIKRLGDGCINPRVFEFYPNGPQIEITNSGALDYFNTIINNEWSFIVYVIDNDSVWSYLNGDLDNVTGRNQIYPISPDFSLGRMNHPAYDAFNGNIDDLGIWNRTLTEQEIQNLYIGTTPQPCVSLPSNLQQGLVGYWPFCGNANDESGNGNDGVVNGATLTEDRFGNANSCFSFDGIGQNIVVANSPVLNPNAITINAWIYPLEDNLCVIKKSNLDNASEYGYGVTHNDLFDVQHGLRSQFGFTDCNTVNDADMFWSDYNTINNGEWSMVTVSINEAGLISHFHNGELILSTQAQPLFSCDSPTSTLRFGGQHWINDPEWFNGSLDDIGIWNRALTPEEVQELYTLNACTFTVYDTSYVTVYDTLTTYETIYDTVYTYETVYDTVTTYVTVTDTLLIDITFVGFEGQPSWLNTVTVFPNPASDHITIDYGNFALMAGYNTVITDAAGATVYSSAVNSQQVSIDINAWGAAGVYYMSIYDANGALVAVRHIVLQ